jgi:hypothetical protein
MRKFRSFNTVVKSGMLFNHIPADSVYSFELESRTTRDGDSLCGCWSKKYGDYDPKDKSIDECPGALKLPEG